MAANRPQLKTLLFVGFLCTAIAPLIMPGWWTYRTLSQHTYKLVKEKHLLVAQSGESISLRTIEDTLPKPLSMQPLALFRYLAVFPAYCCPCA